MYQPNNIQSRLITKEGEPGILLQEVNDTLESLQKWKEEQKKLDEEVEKNIADRRLKKKVEIDEETSPEVEITEINTKNMKCEPGKLIEISNLNLPNLVPAPEIKTINNFELYKTGSDLNDILHDWNSSLDFLMAGSKNEAKDEDEWNQVKDIEKELEELEELMDSLPKLENDIIE